MGIADKPILPAIDFNFEMSILKQLGDRLNDSAIEALYPILDRDNLVIAIAYPEDFTKFQKPSIILQKMNCMIDKIALGNFLGVRTNANEEVEDVHGVAYKMNYQFIINTRNNTDKCLLHALVLDHFLTKNRIDNTGDFTLYDFTGDVHTPVEIGTIQLLSGFDGVSLASNNNNDYAGTISFDSHVIQTDVPTQSFVDLALGYDINYTITL